MDKRGRRSPRTLVERLDKRDHARALELALLKEMVLLLVRIGLFMPDRSMTTMHTHAPRRA
jgi:hypothetical protein